MGRIPGNAVLINLQFTLPRESKWEKAHSGVSHGLQWDLSNEITLTLLMILRRLSHVIFIIMLCSYMKAKSLVPGQSQKVEDAGPNQSLAKTCAPNPSFTV